jgi:hypothetical protein
MTDSKTLRYRAGQARRAASVRTYGDTTVDRDLTKLAEELERDAEKQERENAANRC